MNAPQNAHHALLRNLSHELFQTETSAAEHGRREAKRYDGAPPGVALLAVAAHADEALAELRTLASREDLPLSSPGRVLGEAFSSVREFIADRMIQNERSYRGTLLGMRHGTDVVRMVGHVAHVAERPALAAWSERWLERRLPLVDGVENQLAWFAQNIEQARATSPVK